jgi:N-acetylmuramoyl-L-alanine amidase
VLAVLIVVVVLAAPMVTFASFGGTKICIDAGHGGSDPGACALGDREGDFNLDTALRARSLFQADGATGIMTRTTDGAVSLQGRCDIANNNGAAEFVCTHCNAGGGTGTETFAYASGTPAADMASHVQTELLSHMGTVNRGVKYNNFYVLVNTNMDAILGELAFIDTQADNDKLSSATYRQEAARAYLHGVQAHRGMSPHDPVSDIIVDNTSGSFSCSANWVTGTSSTDKYGTNYRYRSTAAISDAATWAPALSSGNYAVYAWWPAGTNRSATAPYIVHYNGGTATVPQNQQANGGKWNLLGTWNFVNGNNVQLSCWTGAGYNVMADAIKFVPQ